MPVLEKTQKNSILFITLLIKDAHCPQNCKQYTVMKETPSRPPLFSHHHWIVCIPIPVSFTQTEKKNMQISAGTSIKQCIDILLLYPDTHTHIYNANNCLFLRPLSSSQLPPITSGRGDSQSKAEADGRRITVDHYRWAQQSTAVQVRGHLRHHLEKYQPVFCAPADVRLSITHLHIQRYMWTQFQLWLRDWGSWDDSGKYKMFPSVHILVTVL